MLKETPEKFSEKSHAVILDETSEIVPKTSWIIVEGTLGTSLKDFNS